MSSATMHHLLPVLTPTVHALPHPEQRRKSLTTPATTPGQPRPPLPGRRTRPARPGRAGRRRVLPRPPGRRIQDILRRPARRITEPADGHPVLPWRGLQVHHHRPARHAADPHLQATRCRAQDHPNARRSGRKPITQRQQRQVAEFPIADLARMIAAAVAVAVACRSSRSVGATTTGPSRFPKKQIGWAALLCGRCAAPRDEVLSSAATRPGAAGLPCGYSSVRTVAVILRTRSGSAIASISAILSSAAAKPVTVTGRALSPKASPGVDG